MIVAYERIFNKINNYFIYYKQVQKYLGFARSIGFGRICIRMRSLKGKMKSLAKLHTKYSYKSEKMVNNKI